MRPLKIITLAFSIILIAFNQNVHSQVLKKTVVEHFTNTKCSICASRNPGFYSNLNNFPGTLHLSVHPSLPYNNCLLHLQNAVENDARTNYYGIFGSTPRLVVNGNVVSASANYSLPSIFIPYQNQFSAASIRIEQEKFGPDSIRSTITIKTVGSNSLSTLSLFVTLAEDTVFYTGSNGEPMHFDVFRKSLSNVTGDQITLPNTIGDSIQFVYSSPMNNIWNFSRIYTMVILQESGNKNLVQAEAVSASAGQPSTGIENLSNNLNIRLFPNPSDQYINIEAPEIWKDASFQITDVKGHQILIGTLGGILSSVDIGSFAKGVYFIQLKNQSDKSFKFIKN